MKTIENIFNQRLEVRFLVIGGLNTILNYAVSVVLYEALSSYLDVFFILILNSIVSITISFVSQRVFVFRSKNPWLKEYFKMYIVNAVSIGVNILLTFIAVDMLLIPFWFAQGVIAVFLAVFMYFAHKKFTFRNDIK